MLTMINIINEFAVLGGLTSIVVGAIILAVRVRSRRISKKNDGNSEGAGIVETSWRKEYEFGHMVIDAQHRQLFGLSNELVNAVSSKRPKIEVESLLYELVDQVADHFATEEYVLSKTRHPISAKHQEIHHSLLAQATNLRDRYHSGEMVNNDLIGFITRDVVANHIIKEGRRFGAVQSKRSSGDAPRAVEKKRRESTDTVFMSYGDDPESSDKSYLTVPILDKLTPKKVLFNSYPHVWQLICVFAQEPRHLEKYLVLLYMQNRDGKRVGFSPDALHEIADIQKQNQRLFPRTVTNWQSDIHEEEELVSRP